MKKIFTIAFLLGGLSAFAGEPLLLNRSNNNDLLSEKNSLFSRKKMNSGRFLGINNSRFSGSGKEWNEKEVTSGGAYLNLGIFFPSVYFLNPNYKSGDDLFKMGFDLEFGSYFRFVKFADGMYSLGMRATWLSLSYNTRTSGEDKYWVVQGSFLRVGPEFALAINEEMGVDAFYTFGYNTTDMFGSVYSTALSTEAIGTNRLYTGITHEIGAAFHYKVFSAGLGYRFGKLTNISYVYDGEEKGDLWLVDEKSAINNFRITFGFRF